MYKEVDYLKALTEISNDDFNEKCWLKSNFNLYKSTLNWPYNLPPINRSFLVKGPIVEKFNSFYKEILCQFECQLNNKTQTLIIK